LDAFLTDIGVEGGVNVKIERKQEDGPNVGKWGFCAKRQASGNMMEDIQRDFGPGTYQLTLIDAETGKYRRRMMILIHPPAGYSAPGAAPVAVAVPDSRLDGMQRLIETMITAFIAKPAAPVVSPLDDLSKIVGVVAKLIPSPESGNSDRALDMYLRGREEGERSAQAMAALAPAGEGDGQALLKIGLPLVEMAQKQMELNRQTPVQQVQPTGPVPPVEGAESVIPWWVAGLRPYVRDLLGRARAGKNPAVYADMVLEDMPENVLPKIAELLAEADFGARFLSAFPQFGESVEVQKWIAEFFVTIRDGIVDDDDDAVPDPVAPEVVNG
jgi:hypothetical protein